MASRMAISNGDADVALAMADEACSVGRALHDPDVECLGLVYRGHALMAQGEIATGLAHMREPRPSSGSAGSDPGSPGGPCARSSTPHATVVTGCVPRSLPRRSPSGAAPAACRHFPVPASCTAQRFSWAGIAPRTRGRRFRTASVTFGNLIAARAGCFVDVAQKPDRLVVRCLARRSGMHQALRRLTWRGRT